MHGSCARHMCRLHQGDGACVLGIRGRAAVACMPASASVAWHLCMHLTVHGVAPMGTWTMPHLASLALARSLHARTGERGGVECARKKMRCGPCPNRSVHTRASSPVGSACVDRSCCPVGLCDSLWWYIHSSAHAQTSYWPCLLAARHVGPCSHVL